MDAETHIPLFHFYSVVNASILYVKFICKIKLMSKMQNY